MSSTAFPPHVAIIGGGRWARVVAGVLLDIAPHMTRLSLCSPSNPEGWESWLHGRKDQRLDTRIAKNVEALLEDRTLRFVAIVRAARDNAATALAALAADKSVLAEKPFATTLAEAERVVAAGGNGRCSTNLVLLFASNLQRFALAARNLGALRNICIIWHDAKSEWRHGELKSYDVSLNCVQDVFPHIWSLLRLIAPNATLRPLAASAREGGRSAELRLALDDADVTISISRDEPVRQRTIAVSCSGGEGIIDFSKEPGSASINGAEIDIRTGFFSPLACSLDMTARGMRYNDSAPLWHIEHAIESIRIVEEFMPPIRTHQRSALASGLRPAAGIIERQAADYALRELAGTRLAEGRAAARAKGDDVKEVLQHIRSWLCGKKANRSVPSSISEDTDFLAVRRLISETSPQRQT